MADRAEMPEIEVTEAMIDAALQPYVRSTYSDHFGDYNGWGVNDARDTVREIIQRALAARSRKTLSSEPLPLELPPGDGTGHLVREGPAAPSRAASPR